MILRACKIELEKRLAEEAEFAREHGGTGFELSASEVTPPEEVVPLLTQPFMLPPPMQNPSPVSQLFLPPQVPPFTVLPEPPSLMSLFSPPSLVIPSPVVVEEKKQEVTPAPTPSPVVVHEKKEANATEPSYSPPVQSPPAAAALPLPTTFEASKPHSEPIIERTGTGSGFSKDVVDKLVALYPEFKTRSVYDAKDLRRKPNPRPLFDRTTFPTMEELIRDTGKAYFTNYPETQQDEVSCLVLALDLIFQWFRQCHTLEQFIAYEQRRHSAESSGFIVNAVIQRRLDIGRTAREIFDDFLFCGVIYLRKIQPETQFMIICCGNDKYRTVVSKDNTGMIDVIALRAHRHRNIFTVDMHLDMNPCLVMDYLNPMHHRIFRGHQFYLIQDEGFLVNIEAAGKPGDRDDRVSPLFAEVNPYLTYSDSLRWGLQSKGFVLYITQSAKDLDGNIQQRDFVISPPEHLGIIKHYLRPEQWAGVETDIERGKQASRVPLLTAYLADLSGGDRHFAMMPLFTGPDDNHPLYLLDTLSRLSVEDCRVLDNIWPTHVPEVRNYFGFYGNNKDRIEVTKMKFDLPEGWTESQMRRVYRWYRLYLMAFTLSTAIVITESKFLTLLLVRCCLKLVALTLGKKKINVNVLQKALERDRPDHPYWRKRFMDFTMVDQEAFLRSDEIFRTTPDLLSEDVPTAVGALMQLHQEDKLSLVHHQAFACAVLTDELLN